MAEYTVVFDSIGYRSDEELALMEANPQYRPRVSFADKGETVELGESEAGRLMDLGAVVEGAEVTVPGPLYAPPAVTDPAGNPPDQPSTGNEFAEAQAIFHQAMLASGVSADEAYRRAYGAMEDAGSLPEGVTPSSGVAPPSEGASKVELMRLPKADLVARAEAAGVEDAESKSKAELADELASE
jgi:hypothetical protein